MTVWQKISGIATAVGDAGGSVLQELAGVLGLEREGAAPEKSIVFTIAVIALSAKMARSDGVVSGVTVMSELVGRWERGDAAHSRSGGA